MSKKRSPVDAAAGTGDESFEALLVEQAGGRTEARFEQLPVSALPEGEVLVKVACSSLNYKDALAVTGQGKVIRRFPMVPGIDLAGTVLESSSKAFRAGDQVIANGCGLGELHWGGFAQLARLPAEWLLPLPEGLTLQQAMGIGSAGIAAMLCVTVLEAHGCRPESGEIVVTGAAGGVGSLVVAILARLGYTVVAATGREECHTYLKSLGATRIVARSELARLPQKPLETARWAGAIDNVGGNTLAMLLSTMRPGCSVAAVGLAGGHELHTTVYPFILRGVNLLGINAAALSAMRRRQVWDRLCRDLPKPALERIVQGAQLRQVVELSQQLLAGQIRGRLVIEA